MIFNELRVQNCLVKQIVISLIFLVSFGRVLPAQDIHPSITLGREWLGMLSEMYQPDELTWLIAQQAATVAGTQIVFSLLDLKINAYYPKLYQHMPDAAKAESPKLLWGSISGLSTWAVSRLAIDAAVQAVVSWMRERFVTETEDRVFKKYYEHEGSHQLSFHNSTRSWVKSMRENTRVALKGGHELLGYSLKTWVDFGFATWILRKEKSLVVIFYTGIYYAVFHAINSQLSERLMYYKSSIDLLENELVRLEEDFINQPEANKIKKLRELTETKRQELFSQQTVMDWLKIWGASARTLDFAFKYAFVAHRVHDKKLSLDAYKRVFDATWSVSNLLGWMGSNNEAHSRVNVAINSTRQLIRALDELRPNPYFDVKLIEAPEPGIELRDMAIGFGEKKLLDAKSLKFKPGVTALVGKSGSGKTTFLKKLRGLRYEPGWARGDLIFYGPREPKIVLVGQEDSIGLYSTLFQLAGGPLTLLQKNESEFQDNWGAVLSGGEKRMLALDTALNQEADILILDEIFKGMDLELIAKAQRAIQDRFPKAIILVVDHDVEAHNFQGFYDEQIDFNRLSCRT